MSLDADALKSILEKAGVNLASFLPIDFAEDEEGNGHAEAAHARNAERFYMAVVSSDTAVDVWRAVRAATSTTGYYPIFTDDYFDLFEFMEFNEDESSTILERAASVDARLWLAERRKADPSMFEEAEETPGNGWQPHSKEENDAAVDDYYVVRNLGDAVSQMIFVPTTTPWHVASMLRWGNSNDGIDPAEHTAMHRYWYTEYGAEPVCATNSILEFHVPRPPMTKQAAMALAAEQFIYCPDIVQQGCETIVGLASELIYSPRWYFWWD